MVMFVFHVFGTRQRDAQLPCINGVYDTDRYGELAEFFASNAGVGDIVARVDVAGRQRRHVVVLNVLKLGNAELPDEHLFVAFPI
jgi:hypothetical protein